MLQALLRGKLSREQENMEDILTSMVFGSMAYRPPEALALPLLRRAIDPTTQALLSYWVGNASLDYEFWPWLQEQDCNRCQPDLLVRINGQQRTLVLVEAKYRSGKSSREDLLERPNDQLAREWDNVEKLALREGRRPILLYVTADISIPIDEILESQAELARKRGATAKILWVSWRHVVALAHQATGDLMLHDLERVLRRLGLTFFEGVGLASLRLRSHGALSASRSFRVERRAY